MKDYLNILLHSHSHRRLALLYACYTSFLILSLTQFSLPTRYALSLTFLGIFYHLKNMLALPSLFIQLIIMPEQALQTLALTVWFLYHYPSAYLKYKQPLYPFLRSLVTLSFFLFPFFYLSFNQLLISLPLYALSTLWIGSFLSSHLPDGLPENRFFIPIVCFFLAATLLGLSLSPSWGLTIIAIGLLLTNYSYHHIKTQILTRIFLLYELIILSFIELEHVLVVLTFFVISSFFIIDGLYYARPIDDIRRACARTAQSSTLQS